MTALGIISKQNPVFPTCQVDVESIIMALGEHLYNNKELIQTLPRVTTNLCLQTD